MSFTTLDDKFGSSDDLSELVKTIKSKEVTLSQVQLDILFMRINK